MRKGLLLLRPLVRPSQGSSLYNRSHSDSDDPSEVIAIATWWGHASE